MPHDLSSISRITLPLLALSIAGCPTPEQDDATTGDGTSTSTDSTAGTDSTGDTDAVDETGGAPVPGFDPCAEACGMAAPAPAGVTWQRSAGATTTDHCGTYHLGISEDATVAVYSMLQDGVTYVNDGDADVTFQSITAYAAGDDGKPGEWNLRSAAELSLPLLTDDEVAGLTLAPGEGFELHVEGVPFASGDRLGCVVAEFDHGVHYMNVVVGGSTDPMLEFSSALGQDDDQEWSFGSKARVDVDGESVVAEGWHDEQMGPGAVDADGNVILTGLATTSQLDITPVVKLAPDGSMVYAKMLRGQGLGEAPGSAHVHPKGVTDQTGDEGSAQMITTDADGNVYVVSNWEDGGAHRGILVKLDPAGNVLYSRGLLRDGQGLANSGSWFHAIAFTGDRLTITGDVYSGFSGDPLLVTVDPQTGDLLSAHAIVAQPGSANPAWSLCADGDDRVVLTGGSNDGMVASVSGIATGTPTLDWIRKIDIEGAGVKGTSCDMDEQGTAYVAYFGLSTQNQPAMFAVDFDGNALWNARLGNIGSSRNLAQAIVEHEGSVLLGGVLSLTGLDTTAGEGLLLEADASSGALSWAAIYYTGKGTEETSTHGYKGIAIAGDQIVLTGQAYTGTHNIDWFKGYWYDAQTAGAEYMVDSDGAFLSELPNHDPATSIVVLSEATMPGTDDVLEITDMPLDSDLDALAFEEPGYGVEPLADNAGPGTDADGLVQIVTRL